MRPIFGKPVIRRVAGPSCLCATLLAVAAPAARAQDFPTPPAPPPAFFTLSDLLGRSSNWTIRGTIRPRVEALGGQFRPAPSAADAELFSLQTTLFAEYDAGWARIGGELFDSRAYFQRRNASSIAATEVNALELGQLYLGLDLKDAAGGGTTSTLTLGRFTQNIGSRRLVARNQFRNTINAFTGIAYEWRNTGKDALRLFYTLPHYRLPDDRAGILANGIVWDQEGFNLQFFGGHYTRTGVLGGNLEIYGYGLLEEDTGSQLEGIQTRNRQLFTPGVRLARVPRPGTWDYDLEAIYQTGTARDTAAVTDVTDLPVSAYFVHAEAGYTFDAPWKPRVSLHYDHASGDGSDRGRYNRFDTLFGARRFDYGPTSLYGPVQRANLISPGVRVEVAPDPRWNAFLDYRALWLEDPTDSFAATGVRDRTGRSGTFAGQQIEARLRYWLVPKAVQLDTGVAYLIKGDFLRNAPNAPDTGDTIYGYLSTTILF